MSSNKIRREKELVARYASSLVKDGQVVGLGSGTTAAIFVRELAKRIADEGLKVIAIPSSIPMKLLALSLAIPTSSLDEYPEVDLDVDGADEVDVNLNLLKGGSYGVFTNEKILAASSKKFVVIVDHRKPVSRLHTRFPIPLEVLKDARSLVFRRLREMGGEPKLRIQKVDGEEVPLMTERGNLIVEVWFKSLKIGFKELDDELRRIPGVLETGLFLDMTDMVCIGIEEGVRVFKKGETIPKELLI